MTRNTYVQLISAVIVGVLAVLLLDPFMYFMTDAAHMAVLGCLLVAFAVLSVFLLQEGASDEREAVHRMLAGRVAFFVGSLVLVVGIIVESMEGAPNTWLVLALLAMILGKVLARLYAASKL